MVSDKINAMSDKRSVNFYVPPLNITNVYRERLGLR